VIVTAQGHANPQIKIWNIKTCELLNNHNYNSFYDLKAMSGDKALTQLNDRTLKIWNIHTGEDLGTFNTPSPITAQAISNDKVVTGSWDGTVNIYDINTQEVITIAGPHGHYMHSDVITGVAICDDKMATVSGDNTIKVWNINTGTLLSSLAGNTNSASYVDLAMSGDKVVTGSVTTDNTTAKIWDIHTNEVITLAQANGHTKQVRSITTSGNKIATGSQDGTAKIWDIHTGELLYTLEGSDEPISQVEISGNNVLTRSPQGVINIWSLSTINLNTPEFNTRGEALTYIKYTLTIPQSDLIARAYDATQAEQMFTIVDLSEDGKVFLTFDKAVRMFLLKRFNIRLEIENPYADTQALFAPISHCIVQ